MPVGLLLLAGGPAIVCGAMVWVMAGFWWAVLAYSGVGATIVLLAAATQYVLASSSRLQPSANLNYREHHRPADTCPSVCTDNGPSLRVGRREGLGSSEMNPLLHQLPPCVTFHLDGAGQKGAVSGDAASAGHPPALPRFDDRPYSRREVAPGGELDSNIVGEEAAMTAV